MTPPTNALSAGTFAEIKEDVASDQIPHLRVWGCRVFRA